MRLSNVLVFVVLVAIISIGVRIYQLTPIINPELEHPFHIPLDYYLKKYESINVSGPFEYFNDFFAPESYVYDSTEDFIYTTTRDGCVRKVNLEKKINICLVRTGLYGPAYNKPLIPIEECNGIHSHEKCGVPLGINFDNDKNLLVADAYYGILRISNFRSNDSVKVEHLFSNQGTIRFFNSVLQSSKTNKIYFTTSGNRDLKDYLTEAIEANGNGKLWELDPTTKQTKVLLSDLRFANGLVMNRDQTKLFISETSGNRLRVYEIESGKQTKINENFPCHTDNLKVSNVNPNEFIAGCSAPRTPIIKYAQRFPFLIGIMKAFPTIYDLVRPKLFLIAYFDRETGELKRFLYNKQETKASSISEGYEIGNYIYIGSYHNHYLLRFANPMIPHRNTTA